MRVFAISDLHVDYRVNARWLESLPAREFIDDILIVAGDVSDCIERLGWCLRLLSGRFGKVLFVPGNHDLWVIRNGGRSSFAKFDQVQRIADECDVATEPVHVGALSIVPLLGWYDYSFGNPGGELTRSWMDYHACLWPGTRDVREVAAFFVERNRRALSVENETVISFSHFLPRADLIPYRSTSRFRYLLPVLGTTLLEDQIRVLRPKIHVYGHSHVNAGTLIDGIWYCNHALGYPHETGIAARRLICIHEA